MYLPFTDHFVAKKKHFVIFATFYTTTKNTDVLCYDAVVVAAVNFFLFHAIALVLVYQISWNIDNLLLAARESFLFKKGSLISTILENKGPKGVKYVFITIDVEVLFLAQFVNSS